jgi:hypothetical protein
MEVQRIAAICIGLFLFGFISPIIGASIFGIVVVSQSASGDSSITVHSLLPTDRLIINASCFAGAALFVAFAILGVVAARLRNELSTGARLKALTFFIGVGGAFALLYLTIGLAL